MAVPNALQSLGQRVGNIANIAQNASERAKGQALRDAQRANAEAETNAATAQLNQATSEDQKTANQQELDILINTNKAVLDRLAQDTAYRAYSSYNNSGEVRFLNNMLQEQKGNPQGAKKFENTMRVDKFTSSNPTDDALLRQMGVVDIEGFYANQGSLDNIVKITDASGQVKATDLNGFYAMEGFRKLQSSEELAKQLEQSKIVKNLRTSKSSGSTSLERQAQRMIDELGDTRPLAEIVAELTEEKSAPSVVKKRKIVKEKKDELDTLFGGFDNFLKTNIADLDAETFSKTENLIQDIEKIGGHELSSGQKKKTADIAKLIAVAGPAAEISAEETGVFDSVLTGLRKKVSDSAKGLDSTSAYAAFRNTLRHAMFGSALTSAEITSFNEAFGTLGQQVGPILSQFKTSLTQVKAELQSIQRSGDARVSHFRLGISQDELQVRIDRIDERLKFLDEADTSGKIAPNIGEQALDVVKGAFGTDVDAESVVGQDVVDDIFGGGF